VSTGQLILASASSTRAALLRGAGIEFSTVAAELDEAALRDSLVRDQAQPEEIARLIAALLEDDHPLLSGETIYLDGGHAITHGRI